MTNNPAADGAPAPSAFVARVAAPGYDLLSPPISNIEDQDTGDIRTGVDEDALDADNLDTDQVASRDSSNEATSSTPTLPRITPLL